jgi:error-prone DNA polymerase
MGFYHPATLVKDAQRHGVRFAPVDVQHSRWECEVEEDGTIRSGLRYVAGLRRHVGEAIERAMRFRSLEDVVKRTGANKEELAVLAEIGALNAFGYHRREALWQIEKAIRPAGELYEEGARDLGLGASQMTEDDIGPAERAGERGTSLEASDSCPLQPMNVTERLVADYQGTHLTIGPHPMALRRRELALRGVLRAIDLPRERQGRRIRVAGTVITRQRPGTAKGFVFLTLEDETGIANIIVHPDLFARDRLTVVDEPFLVIDGVLQNQEGVTSVRAERVQGLQNIDIDFDAHDFY